ncbi:MAG: hypothetical protein K2H43_05895, partial [Clostridia bacterium]|nr:hypothetical protein [Clostridia bacterium]
MLVFVMACTLLFGVWSLHTGKIARAEENGSSVTLSTDLKNGKVSKGKSFTLITTLKTTRELFRNSTNPLMPLDTDRYWASISLRIGLLNDDKDDWNATASDHISAATLVEDSGVSYRELVLEYEGGIRLDMENAYDNSSVDQFNSTEAAKDSLNRGQCLILSFSSKHTNPNATFTGDEVVIKATITVDEDMPTGVYTFGMIQTGTKASISDSVTFSKSKADTDSLIVNSDGAVDKGTLTANEVQFEVVDASDDATLNGVKIGQGTATNPVPADEDFTALDWGTDEDNPVTPVYTVTGPDLDKIVI